MIYESVDGVIYSREIGSSPESRKEVGWAYDPRTSDGRPLTDHLKDDQLWGEIRRAAATNESLKIQLERCKILYLLSKEYEDRHGRKT